MAGAAEGMTGTIDWPDVHIERRQRDDKMLWTPALLEACLHARRQGATTQEMAEHYGVSAEGLRHALLHYHVGVTNEAERLTLPCGCRPGHRCQEAERLWAAVQAIAGSGNYGKALQEARQAYYAHVSRLPGA